MADTRLLRFNINEYVRVKFSPASLALWREHAEEMREYHPKMAYLWPLEPPVDEEGYYRAQFWSVMHLVAPNLVAGGSAFEDCLIELEIPAASLPESPVDG
jgi:hypothetical protein